jgi:hypothetical protein
MALIQRQGAALVVDLQQGRGELITASSGRLTWIPVGPGASCHHQERRQYFAQHRVSTRVFVDLFSGIKLHRRT